MSVLDKLNPLKWIADAAGEVLDKIVGDKASDAEKMQFKLQLNEMLHSQEEQFTKFVIEHSGAAKDMPRVVQIVRGLIRPLITLWAFGLLNWACWYIFNTTDLELVDRALFVLKILFGVNILTLGFWFGTKALERSGLAQVLMGWKGGKNDAS